MTVELSGYYYPNKMARIHIFTIQQSIGKSAMQAVFDQAGVPQALNPPPDNYAKAFDFAYYGALGAALEKMYGYRAERGVALHAGRAAFEEGMAEYGELMRTSDLAFKAIPLNAKLKIGLKALATTFTRFSDQTTDLDDEGERFVYTIHRCPNCWGRSSLRPICYSSLGVIEAACNWISNGKYFQMEEVACHALGDEACVFHISKEPLNTNPRR